MSIGISEDHAALAETARRWAEQVVGAAGRRHGLEDEAPDASLPGPLEHELDASIRVLPQPALG